MSRVSQAQAQENRVRVVAAASRLFRERGVPSVSVVDVMNSVGMTHGAFYRHFASKDALVAEAATRAFQDVFVLLADLDDSHSDRSAARRVLVDCYLSAEHRDEPGTGCPAAGFAGDMAHAAEAGESQKAYTDGVRQCAQWLSSGEGDDGLATVSTLVGAILLARATAGTDLSEDILAAARRAAAALD